jgi:RNA polymerase sigma factor (sigma-70 family)
MSSFKVNDTIPDVLDKYLKNRKIKYRNILVEFYEPYVRKIIFTVTKCNTQYSDDLYGAGCIALISAIEKFDDNKGMSLKSWIFIKVRNKIIDEIRAITKNRKQEERTFVDINLIRNSEIENLYLMDINTINRIDDIDNMISYDRLVHFVNNALFLSDKEKILFNLIYVKKLSYGEAAKRVGYKNEGCAYTAVNLIRRKIRKSINCIPMENAA